MPEEVKCAAMTKNVSPLAKIIGAIPALRKRLRMVERE